MQHEFVYPVVALASASHDINGIINDTTQMSISALALAQKGHIIPLTIINITNAMDLLMASSASCYKKHVIVMYVLKTNMPLKCHTQATFAN